RSCRIDMERDGLVELQAEHGFSRITTTRAVEIAQLSGGISAVGGASQSLDAPGGGAGILLLEANLRILTIRVVAIRKTVQVVIPIVVALFWFGRARGIESTAGIGTIEQAVAVLVDPAGTHFRNA